MSPENDKALCEAFPLLYARRKLSIYETPMGRGFECDDGWYDLIYELSAKLEAIIVTLPEDQRFCADQVKEKLAGLRFYTKDNKVTPEGYGLIGEAMHKSLTICEVCGQPGEKRTLRGCWLKTVCEADYEKLRWSSDPVEKLREQQQIVREAKLRARHRRELEGRIRNAKTPEALEKAQKDLFLFDFESNS